MKPILITRLDRNSTLVVDTLGDLYQHIIPIPIRNFDSKGLPFPCVYVCGKDLRRPHFTCLGCRERRVYSGQMPNMIPVDMILMLNAKNKRLRKIKNALLKNLLRFAEVFLLN